MLPQRFNLNTFVYACLFFMLIPAFHHAQAPQKYGQVSKEDLAMTVYPNDSAATAAILFDKGDLDFNFAERKLGVNFKKHKRIKILKRAGFDYGDIIIGYYSESGGEKIRTLKAMIHNPDGSKEKLSKKDFFEEEVDGSYTRIKFSFPNIQEGSVIEYEYEKFSPYVVFLPEWFFQHDIPTRWSEYNLRIPNYYKYVGISQGRALDVSEHNEGTARYTMTFEGGVSASSRGTSQLLVTNSKLVIKDAPAMKEESFITNMDDYRARVRYQLQGTSDASGVYTPFLTDWNDVSKTLLEHDQFGMQLEKKKNFKGIKEAIASSLNQLGSEYEKAALIYDHINNNISWNEEFGYMADKNLADCYQQKIASAGEMNLLLLGMLKDQGILAYPLLVSTRGNGKMLELYPIVSQFNHVMVLANLDGKDYIMDAGNNCRPIGMPRANALNGYKAMLIDKESAQWVQIPSQKSKTVQMAKVSMDEDGKVSGTISEMRSGFSAVATRNVLEEQSADDYYDEAYTEDFPEIEIEQVEISATEDMKSPFKANVDFSIPNQAMVNGDFIYFTPMLSKWFEENPFKLEKREYPVDFNLPINQRYVLVMELPEDYVVEEAPANAQLTLPDRSATFTYNFTQMGTKISMNCALEIKKLQYGPDEYASLKKFFDLIVEKQNEQLVLKYADE